MTDHNDEVEKDEVTTALRREIMEGAGYVAETDRADAMTITLSFQSRTNPDRHVWIDTRMGEDGSGFTVDLEDWTREVSWDNAVASVDTADAGIARDVARAWLRGDPLDDCLRLCAGCQVTRRDAEPG
jgi:hypothetical protein